MKLICSTNAQWIVLPLSIALKNCLFTKHEFYALKNIVLRHFPMRRKGNLLCHAIHHPDLYAFLGVLIMRRQASFSGSFILSSTNEVTA